MPAAAPVQGDFLPAHDIGQVMAIALDQGHCIAIIASRDHRERLELELYGRGVDLEEARHARCYVWIDVEPVLAQVLKDGHPDVQQFRAAIGRLLSGLHPMAQRIEVFSEMVALLWERNEFEAARALDALWRAYVAASPVLLYCAHSAGVLEGADAFHAVCLDHCQKLHSSLLPRPRQGG